MSELTGKYVFVQGIRTYYESCGTGKTDLVLIHTAGRDNRQWHGFMEELGSKYRLFAPDLPGHGKSFPLKDIYCYEDILSLAEWIWKFCLSLGIERPVIVGCSMGGNLALLEGALFPNHISAVVALQGADYTPTFGEANLSLMTHPQVSLMHTNMDFSMSLVGPRATETGREMSEWGVLSLIPIAQQHDLRAYTRCDSREMMQRIKCPVLLARGTADWLVSEDIVKGAQSRITNAKVVEFQPIEGLGHFPHLEDPVRVAHIVNEFLDKHLS